MLMSPAYGAPVNPEAKFDEIPTRLAERAVRWFRLARIRETVASNRRFRTESRKKYGYDADRTDGAPDICDAQE